MIVAVDGPAGSGKGTVTKRIEKELGFLNLDTGATYRCVALATLKNNVKLEETEKIIQIANEIVEGRDIGTVVFPNADLKIYLDASEEIRAKRRYKENMENGINTTYEEVLENVKLRDYNDKNKKVGALKKAEDAVVIDSSKMNIDEVVEKVKELIKQS